MRSLAQFIHRPCRSTCQLHPEKLLEAAISVAAARAAILHLHARNPETGIPSQDRIFQFLPQIKEATNAVVNITTGGSPHMTVEERMKPVATFKPELASLNMGSMNFGLYPMLNRFKTSNMNGRSNTSKIHGIWYSKYI